MLTTAVNSVFLMYYDPGLGLVGVMEQWMEGTFKEALTVDLDPLNCTRQTA